MEPVDYVVIGSVIFFFFMLAIHVYDGRVFESPGLSSSLATIYLSITGLYLLTGSNPWIGGACALLSIAYYIQALSLKGSK